MKQDDKIVIFDWGGVIESHKEGEYNIRVAASKFRNYFGISKESTGVEDIFDIDINGKKIGECNKLEIELWYERLNSMFNMKCSFNEFCKVYNGEYSKIYYYKDVVDFAHSLKQYCKIGILSNLIYLDKQRLNMQVNLKEFDYVWLSFELGPRKPDERIYKVVEEQCKIKPNNIMFIDVREDNIEVARNRGWNTCNATGPELDKIKESVNSFLNSKY